MSGLRAPDPAGLGDGSVPGPDRPDPAGAGVVPRALREPLRGDGRHRPVHRAVVPGLHRAHPVADRDGRGGTHRSRRAPPPTCIIRKFDLTGYSAAAVEELFATSADATSDAERPQRPAPPRLRRLVRPAHAGDVPLGVGTETPRASAAACSPRSGLFALLVEIVVLSAVNGVRPEPVPALALGAADHHRHRPRRCGPPSPTCCCDREVHWRRMLVAGAIMAVGTALLGAATAVYMGPLVTEYTAQFGLFGITIAMIGWLLAAAGVLVSQHGRRSGVRRLERSAAQRGQEAAGPARPGRGAADRGRPERLRRPQQRRRAAADPGARELDWRWPPPCGRPPPWCLASSWPEASSPTSRCLCSSGLVNAVVGPLLYLVALPLSVSRVGGSALVVNTVLLALTAG